MNYLKRLQENPFPGIIFQGVNFFSFWFAHLWTFTNIHKITLSPFWNGKNMIYLADFSFSWLMNFLAHEMLRRIILIIWYKILGLWSFPILGKMGGPQLGHNVVLHLEKTACLWGSEEFLIVIYAFFFSFCPLNKEGIFKIKYLEL